MTRFEFYWKLVSPNQRNCYGETALHWACKLDNQEMVKMFIRYGGEVNLSDAEGNTPLHWAAEYDKLGIVKVLLKLGARPDLRNDRNLTPYQLARLAEVSAPTCNKIRRRHPTLVGQLVAAQFQEKFPIQEGVGIGIACSIDIQLPEIRIHVAPNGSRFCSRIPSYELASQKKPPPKNIIGSHYFVVAPMDFCS